MNYSDKIAKLSEKIKEADTIVIGAGPREYAVAI